MFNIEENSYGDIWFITKTTIYNIHNKVSVKVETIMIFYSKQKAIKYLKQKKQYKII